MNRNLTNITVDSSPKNLVLLIHTDIYIYDGKETGKELEADLKTAKTSTYAHPSSTLHVYKYTYCTTALLSQITITRTSSRIPANPLTLLFSCITVCIGYAREDRT